MPLSFHMRSNRISIALDLLTCRYLRTASSSLRFSTIIPRIADPSVLSFVPRSTPCRESRLKISSAHLGIESSPLPSQLLLHPFPLSRTNSPTACGFNPAPTRQKSTQHMRNTVQFKSPSNKFEPPQFGGLPILLYYSSPYLFCHIITAIIDATHRHRHLI